MAGGIVKNEQLCLLLADDDADDKAMITGILDTMPEKPGYVFLTDSRQVIPVLDSIEAENLPLLIVLDLNMPFISGIELTRLIRESPRYGDIPVVILSTSDREECKKNCIAAGAQYYFEKPTGYGELVRLMEMLYSMSCGLVQG